MAHVPHAIMNPECSFVIYVEDMIWCIPQVSALIKECKQIMAQW